MMKAYHGVLERVGAGTWKNGATKISVIKIGDQTLANIAATDLIYSYLDVGSSMTIYVHRFMFIGKIIIGVKQDGGEKMSLSLATVLLYLFGMSFIFLILGFFAWIGLFYAIQAMSCPSYNMPTSEQKFVIDKCLNNSSYMAAFGVIAYYLGSVYHLVKDYLIVKTLLLIK